MRQKIDVSGYGIKRLVYGAAYCISYGGSSCMEDFRFSRKNTFTLSEYRMDGKKEVRITSRTVSRRELKRLLSSGCVNWLGAYGPDPSDPRELRHDENWS